jgi:hypothetical protein
MEDLYRLYRFTKVEIEFCQGDGGGGFISYANGGTLTNPTTAQLCSQMDHFVVCLPEQTVPARMILTKRDLIGVPTWYSTTSVGDPEVDTQGIFHVGVTNDLTGLAVAGALSILIRYTCEFKERVPAAVSMDRQRERLEAIQEGGDSMQPDRPVKGGGGVHPLRLKHRSVLAGLGSRSPTT